MLTRDLKGREGEFVQLRLTDGERGVGRLEGFAAPRWTGDKRTVSVRRWRVDGPFEARVAPKDVLEFTEPDAKLLAIIGVIEESA